MKNTLQGINSRLDIQKKESAILKTEQWKSQPEEQKEKRTKKNEIV